MRISVAAPPRVKSGKWGGNCRGTVKMWRLVIVDRLPDAGAVTGLMTRVKVLSFFY